MLSGHTNYVYPSNHFNGWILGDVLLRVMYTHTVTHSGAESGLSADGLLVLLALGGGGGLRL